MKTFFFVFKSSSHILLISVIVNHFFPLSISSVPPHNISQCQHFKTVLRKKNIFLFHLSPQLLLKQWTNRILDVTLFLLFNSCVNGKSKFYFTHSHCYSLLDEKKNQCSFCCHDHPLIKYNSRKICSSLERIPFVIIAQTNIFQ